MHDRPLDAGSPHDELPLDSDIEVQSDAVGIARPIHLRPVVLLLVAGGGALGTAAREGLAGAIPLIGSLPLATLSINVAGALILGALLEGLVRRGPDVGRRRTLRLVLGTGFCGGFTTYSAFATETASLLGNGHPAVAISYAALTVVLGGLATAGGIAIAATHHRRVPSR